MVIFGMILRNLGSTTKSSVPSDIGLFPLISIAVIATILLLWTQTGQLINLYNQKYGQTVTVRGSIYKREYESLSSTKSRQESHVIPIDRIQLDEEPVRGGCISIKHKATWIYGAGNDVLKNVPISVNLRYSWLGISLLSYSKIDDGN